MLTKLFYQTHEDSCQYGDVLCRACGKAIERRMFEDHRTNECVNRVVACAYCGGEVRISNMKVFPYTYACKVIELFSILNFCIYPTKVFI